MSVSLTGRNYLGYDLAQIGGASQPIIAEKEHLHLEFKTSAANGLLFYTGEYIVCKSELFCELF